MEITVIGGPEVDALLRDYPARITKAMVRAMNRGIGSARTLMVREIARDTGLRSTDVRNALSMREATNARPEARLATSLKRIPLIKFNARGPEPSRGRGRGVTYRLSGGRGRHPNAFIATMPTHNKRGVFVRDGEGKRKSPRAWSKNLPIRELFGPSLGHVFAKYRSAAGARAKEQFDKNFAHELDFAASQGSVGGAD